ncbi:Hypothetical predicted protein [Pelobates cultripes]|uniref:DBB domain-containing protein n=1 Tax=Pelobates cultripes TaxID=61616 RepID=A0AAD1WBF2_PELCU|nr:Hypothetical predicted protein [Pelobates cultripes]
MEDDQYAQIISQPGARITPTAPTSDNSNPGEIYLVLRDKIPNNSSIDIEFCTENHFVVTRQATQWNEEILYVKAPDLPAGLVAINLWHENVIKASTHIEYYTATGEIERLLTKVIDPIAFICQAFNVYSLKDLDMVLTKSLHKKMSSCEFSLHEIIQHANTRHSEEIPTLLHCAAKFGLKEVALLLMSCQGADQISRITNKYGDDPATIAEKHGHKEIQNIIQQLTLLTYFYFEIETEHACIKLHAQATLRDQAEEQEYDLPWPRLASQQFEIWRAGKWVLYAPSFCLSPLVSHPVLP